MRQGSVYAAELGTNRTGAGNLSMFSASLPRLVSPVVALVVYVIAMLSAAIGHWPRRSVKRLLRIQFGAAACCYDCAIAGCLAASGERSASRLEWWDSYSLVLFMAAIFYARARLAQAFDQAQRAGRCLGTAGLLGHARKQTSLQFIEHPQLWLVPPALATLVFVEFNRRRPG